jgi:c-di-GMP phosphodiesterase
METFIARQPVFDRDERLVAYDLFYRDMAATANDPAGSLAVERLITQTFLGPGLDQIAEGLPVFLPIARSLLERETIRVIHPRRAILQFPAGTDADAGLVAHCQTLYATGYRFAAAAEDVLRCPELAVFVGIARLDAAAHSPESLASAASSLKARGVRVLADHVPNLVVRTIAQAAGVALFVGYNLTQPEVLTKRDVAVDHVQAFQLLRLIRDPDTSDQAIEQSFRRDVALTYKLLRLVNSAAMGRYQLYTIGHAIRVVGRAMLHRWLTLLLVSSSAERNVDLEIAHLALTRARMCERIVEMCGIAQAGGSLFMVGLCSKLDALLQTPLPVLVEHLELAPDVARALIQHEDFYGAILSLVEAYESGAWTRMLVLCQDVGVAPTALPALHVEAIQWAREQLRDSVAEDHRNRTLRTVSATVRSLAG